MLSLLLLLPASLQAMASGLPATIGAATGALHWFDFDSDGDLDVLSIEGGVVQLLRNENAGQFEDVTVAVGLDAIEGVEAALVGDFGGDARSDLVLAGTVGVRLLQQVGDGFVDVAPHADLEELALVTSLAWVDANADERLDLHVVAGGIHRVFASDSSRVFIELDLGLSSPRVGAVGGMLPGTLPVDSDPTGDRAARDDPGFGHDAGADPRARGTSIVTPSPGTASVAPGAPALNISSCVQSISDQGGGACIEASRMPTLGMLYPMSVNLNVDDPTGRVGILTTQPTARLDVNALSSDSYAIEATISSSADDAAAIYGDVTGESSNPVYGVLGRADGGGLGSRSVLGIMDRNGGGSGQAAVEGRFIQGESAWGNSRSGVRGVGEGSFGVEGVGEGDTVFNDYTVPGCGVRGRGFGEYTGSGSVFYPATGVWGTAYGDRGHGVRGEANVADGIGVLGQCDDPSGYAGFFEGRVEADGVVRSTGSSGGNFTALNPDNQSASASLNWLNDVARIRVGGSGSGAGNGLDIQTTGDASLMRILGNGDVGIGTASPVVRLHVSGGSDVGPGGGGYVQCGSLSGDNVAIDTNEIMARSNGAAATLNLNVEGGDVIINNGSAPGNVGIGTSSPGARLQVDGDIGADALRVRVDGTTRLLVDDSGQVAIGANTATSFDLQISASAPGGGTAGKPGGGAWSVSSDRRLKKDIADLDGALETLLALRGVTYEYKDPEAIGELSGTRIGFIAQEVEDVLPDWVGEKPDGMKMLSIRGFEALAVEAIRELDDRRDAEIAEMGAELAERDAELAELRARVEELESLEDELASLKAMVAAMVETD